MFSSPLPSRCSIVAASLPPSGLMLKLVAGLITITGVSETATATSDGVHATASGTSKIAGLTIAGHKIALDKQVDLGGATKQEYTTDGRHAPAGTPNTRGTGSGAKIRQNAQTSFEHSVTQTGVKRHDETGTGR